MKPITKSVCSSAMRTVASVYAPVANAPAEDIWPTQNNTGLWSQSSNHITPQGIPTPRHTHHGAFGAGGRVATAGWCVL